MAAVWHSNSVSDFGTFPSTHDMVLPSNTVAGRQIVVLLYHSYLGCPVTLTDSQGNTYTQHSANPSEATGYLYVFTAIAGQSAACTITATYSCGNIRQYFAAEVSGLDTSSIFDVESLAADTTSPYGTGVTTTTNGALVMAMFNKEGSDPGATSIDSPFTLVNNTASYVDAYAIQSSAGAITPALNGPSGTIITATVAFKATASAPSTAMSYAKLTRGVHKKKRLHGLVGGMSTAPVPIGVASASFAVVNKTAPRLTRPKLKRLIRKGRPSFFRLIGVRPPEGFVPPVGSSDQALRWPYNQPWTR